MIKWPCFRLTKTNLYTEIIEPIGYRAREHNEDFEQRMGMLHNQMTKDLLDRFCNQDMSINWEKLVVFNSGNMNRPTP